MAKDNFVLQRRRLEYSNTNRNTIKISQEAYNSLVDMANESSMPMKDIASQAIVYAFNHLEYKTMKGDEDDGAN